jgi:hypothetical protein
MKMNMLASVRALSDAALLSRVSDLARRERDSTVELVAHLAELEARKLHRAEGYGSLFRYCTDVLRLSEHAAYGRIEAARVAQAFPVVLERLAEGSLNLTTLCLVGPHLRPEDHLELLAQVAGRSKRDVLALVARLAPRPDLPPSVRKLPHCSPLGAHQDLPASGPAEASPDLPACPPGETQKELPACASGPGLLITAREDNRPPAPAAGLNDGGSAVTDPLPSLPSAVITPPAPAVPEPSARRPVIVPSAADRYRIQFTMRQETQTN